MYKVPKIESIEILGVTVKIEIDQYKLDVEDEADGLYCNKLIYLKKEYKNKQEYQRVFFHETIHALCDILGAQLDDTTEEVLANTISYVAMQHFFK